MLISLASRLEIALEPPATRDPRIPNTFYRITFRDANRDTAVAVVDALLNAFVEKTMGSEYSGTQKAQRFFEGKMKEYSDQLERSRSEARGVQEKEHGPGAGRGGRLLPAPDQRHAPRSIALEGQLSIATSRRAELQRQLRGETPFVPDRRRRPRCAAVARRAARRTRRRASRKRETRLDELLLRFTDKHPDVLATRETLEQLKARQQEEIAALRRGDAGAAAASGAASNPVFQNIQLQLNQTDVEIAALRVQLAEHRRIEGELRRVVDTAPEVEAEYPRLTRDYDVTQTQYNELLERLERARLSEDAAETGVGQFRHRRSADRRRSARSSRTARMLLAAVLFGGLVLGVGVAWLMHMLRPVFSSARSVAELTGLPVLGCGEPRPGSRSRRPRCATASCVTAPPPALLLVLFIVVEVIKNPRRATCAIFWASERRMSLVEQALKKLQQARGCAASAPCAAADAAPHVDDRPRSARADRCRRASWCRSVRCSVECQRPARRRFSRARFTGTPHRQRIPPHQASAHRAGAGPRRKQDSRTAA